MGERELKPLVRFAHYGSNFHCHRPSDEVKLFHTADPLIPDDEKRAKRVQAPSNMGFSGEHGKEYMQAAKEQETRWLELSKKR